MKTYTMRDWKAAGTFNAAPGQEISGEIYGVMRDCLPPKAMPKETAKRAWTEHQIPVHAGFLMGEPHTVDEKGQPLYLAFGSNNYGRGSKYYYLGLSKAYRPLHGSYYYFDCMNAFVNGGLFPVSDFDNDKEAIKYAADYEATLYKYDYDHGDRISTETLYTPMFL